MARRHETNPSLDPEPRHRSAPVNTDDVARRAYELYEARGAEPGADLDDWLRAERELGTPMERDPDESA